MKKSSSSNRAPVKCFVFAVFFSVESRNTDESVCARGPRGEAHCGGRTSHRATAGPPTGRGASPQRLHLPTAESEKTTQYNLCIPNFNNMYAIGPELLNYLTVQ